MQLSFQWTVLVLAVMLLMGIPYDPLRAADSEATQTSLNDGYSLFYDFCNQESQVSLLLWIKTTPPDIAAYTKEITATAKADMAILKNFSANNPAMKLDKISLPPFELSVRKSMADDRKQELIWGSSGAAFAQAVRMTQSEVTNYGLHVAKVLSETEPNPDRARAMHEIYEKWKALHEEAYKLGR
jgi:hypothetical protein